MLASNNFSSIGDKFMQISNNYWQYWILRGPDWILFNKPKQLIFLLGKKLNIKMKLRFTVKKR